MSGQISKPPSEGVTADRGGSGNTGATCPHSGPYKCNTHPDMLVSFQRGQTFPACPIGVDTKKAAEGHATSWVMVRETDAAAYDTKVQRSGAELEQ